MIITLEDYKNIFSLSEQKVLSKNKSVHNALYQMASALINIRVTRVHWNFKAEENRYKNGVHILYQETATHIPLDQETEIKAMISVNSGDNIIS